MFYLIDLAQGRLQRPAAVDGIAVIRVVVGEDVYIRLPDPVQPGFLSRKLRIPPAMLTVHHAAVYPIKNLAFHPDPAARRFYPYPVPVRYAKTRCRLPVDLGQRVGMELAHRIDLPPLGVK